MRFNGLFSVITKNNILLYYYSKQMVYVTLIYGYALTKDYIEDLFDRDQYPELYNEDDDFGIEIINATYEMLKNYIDPKIKMIATDFEFSTFYGNYKNRGESTLLIGVELLRCEAHYNGTAMFNEVTDDIKQMLTDSININLGIYDNLGVHLYIDAEK